MTLLRAGRRVDSAVGPAAVGVAALVVVVASTGALLSYWSRAGTEMRVVLVALASAAVPVAAWSAERGALALRSVLAAVVVAMALAVALPSRGSGDLWSYAMYGRIVAVHHASPYSTSPASFPNDPFLARVGHGWRDTPSVYGAVFVGYAGVGALVAGGSELAARLYFQLGAAACVLGALALVWRRTRSPAAVAWLGLNPLIVVELVNGGHNDAMVGLAVLASVLAAEKGRHRTSGVLIGLAGLVKLSAGLAVVGLVPWLWRRDGRRAACSVAGSAGLVVVAGTVPFGRAARALIADPGQISRASVWQLPHHLLGEGSGLGRTLGLDPGTVSSVLSVAALVAVAALAVRAATAASDDGSPAGAVASSLLAYGVAGAYVLPWYSAWWLPAAALQHRSRIAWLALAQAAFMLAVYQPPWAWPPPGSDESWAGPLGSFVVPALLLVCFLVATRHHGSARAAAPGPAPAHGPGGPGGPGVVTPPGPGRLGAA